MTTQKIRTVLVFVVMFATAVLMGANYVQAQSPSEEQQADGVRSLPDKPSYSSGHSVKSAELNNEAIVRIRAGKYREAIPLLLEAVKESRSNVDAWDHLGVCYRRTGRIQEAITAYKTSMQINPKNPVPYTNLGLVYLQNLKDYDQALIWYSKVVEVDPTDPEGPYGIGLAYRAKQDYVKAIPHFLKSVDLYQKARSPVVADAYRQLGECYSRRVPPNDSEAVKFFMQARQAGDPLDQRIESYIRSVMRASASGAPATTRASQPRQERQNERASDRQALLPVSSEQRSEKDNALLAAAQSGEYEAVKRLLYEGASVACTDPIYRATPLHWASYKGHQKIVKLLLEKGAELNATNKDNRTPLILAAGAGRRAVVVRLLGNKADKTVKDKDGRTALDWAEAKHHRGVARMLKDQ